MFLHFSAGRATVKNGAQGFESPISHYHGQTWPELEGAIDYSEWDLRIPDAEFFESASSSLNSEWLLDYSQPWRATPPSRSTKNTFNYDLLTTPETSNSESLLLPADNSLILQPLAIPIEHPQFIAIPSDPFVGDGLLDPIANCDNRFDNINQWTRDGLQPQFFPTAPIRGSGWDFISPFPTVNNDDPVPAAQQQPPSCYICPDQPTFTRHSDLVRHQVSVHGINQSLHLCPVLGCPKGQGRSYSRADKLTEHMWKKHADLGYVKRS
ncbi:hypothetical protein DL95DRAFT_451388 [Leptodontidium sp. 2 PMI_412]|nr:hypothetical protein DL95DRAFT_451388 [Leptodontidium sp. 2 PMI_412]